MGKHTPGPWVVEDSRRFNYQMDLTAGPSPLGVIFGRMDGAENEANARLIAAAPELLELLVDAVMALEWDAYPELVAKAKKAIEKAGGELK